MLLDRFLGLRILQLNVMVVGLCHIVVSKFGMEKCVEIKIEYCKDVGVCIIVFVHLLSLNC